MSRALIVSQPLHNVWRVGKHEVYHLSNKLYMYKIMVVHREIEDHIGIRA